MKDTLLKPETPDQLEDESGSSAPICSAPVLGATYLWDYGGNKKEEITVQEISHETIQGKTHEDGSYSPETTRTKIRISDCGWIGWYRGSQFELLQNDEIANP